MKDLLLISFLCVSARALPAQDSPLNAVHEWGTFTSFSGSDSMPIAWWTTALTGPAELPEFVSVIGSKGIRPYPLRMETPVLYFYASQPTTVNVRVDYPRGMITEVYPPGKIELPKELIPDQLSTAHSWTVDLQPPASALLNPPRSVGTRGAHYQHARNVPDAWIVHHKVPLSNAGQPSLTTEKFIFYRGAGNGALPVQASVQEDGALTIGAYSPLATEAFFIRVQKGVTHWRGGQISLKTDSERRIQAVKMEAPDSTGSADTLAEALRKSLTSAGLTPAESAAMVATWHEAWLGEEGTRLLYLIPETWVNQQLPLQITPAPRELKRVFVARSELITPQQEKALVAALIGSHDDAQRWKIIQELGHGRFTEPAVERALKVNEQDLRNTYYRAVAQKPKDVR